MNAWTPASTRAIIGLGVTFVPEPLAMSDVTHILSQIESGDPSAAEQLLPLVYEELRKLAAARLAQEKPGQTLQATALVHEAYLRLVGWEKAQHWDSRGHFFAAAAEAMRRILIESARRKGAAKRGGTASHPARPGPGGCPGDVGRLAGPRRGASRAGGDRPQVAELVKLRYFAGLTNREAAECLGDLVPNRG